MTALPALRCGPHTLSLNRTLVMGVLNVTPDSFSDGGRFLDADAALGHARSMIEDGADIIDVGGESTAPGASPISASEELERVLPVVTAAVELGVVVSIDSHKPQVARAALEAGATLLNDVTGLEAPEMIALAREFEVPAVLMHMQGRPQNMQANPRYLDVVTDIVDFFRERTRGLDDLQIVLDPGFGFGKTVEHNLELLRRLEEFHALGRPLLVGASRKRFLGAITGAAEDQRLGATVAAHTVAIMNGADIIRAHDVAEAVRAARVTDAVRRRTVP